MKKIGVMFGLFMLAVIVVSVAGSGNYSPSNSAVEGNFLGVLIADGSPRPPFPPAQAFDDSLRQQLSPPTTALNGSPRPPFPPTLVADGSPRPPFPPAAFDGSPRPPFPPRLSA